MAGAGGLRQVNAHQLGLKGRWALDNEQVRGCSGQGAWRTEGKGRAAAHWARARMLGTRTAPEGSLSLVTRATLGSTNIWRRQALLGDACRVKDRLFLKASLSECHLAIQGLIHCTIHRVARFFLLTLRDLGQRVKTLTVKTRPGHKWCCH